MSPGGCDTTRKLARMESYGGIHIPCITNLMPNHKLHLSNSLIPILNLTCEPTENDISNELYMDLLNFMIESGK